MTTGTLDDSSVREFSSADVSKRELQQEIVHFTRIVDLNWLTNPAVRKRLKRSLRIDDRVKFLTELLLVAGSRLVQQEHLTSAPCKETNILSTRAATVVLGRRESAFALVVQESSNRIRKHCAYLFAQLLDHLPARLALYALAYHYAAVEPSRGLHIQLVVADADGELTLLAVNDSIRSSGGLASDDLLTWLLRHIPLEAHLGRRAWTAISGLPAEEIQISAQHGELTVKLPTGQIATAILKVESVDLNYPCEVVLQRVLLDLSPFHGSVASIECGHIHLDRKLNNDQIVGITLGTKLAEQLSTYQKHHVPILPLIDDDHVSCVLNPAQLLNIFQRISHTQPVDIIPESSPIIRMINRAIFNCVVQPRLRHCLVSLGGNTYLSSPSGLNVELFEDRSGLCATGCIFFEIALLIYRSAPERFQELFAKLSGVSNLHKTIISILSQETAPDVKAAQLRELYASFEDITSPDKGGEGPDKVVMEAVFRALENRPTHVNVLEYYYSSQQEKVRSLIKLLGLNLTLVSVFFDTANKSFRSAW